jgi:lipopolysaccharide export system permease protein
MASLVPMALPLAVLLASIMTFGNLGEYNELLALKSAGISLQRIMFPVMFFVILVSLGAFFFNNHVLPYSNLKMRSLLFDIQRQNPELSIRPGIFDNSITGYSIRVESRDPRTNLLKNIRIYDHSDRLGNIIVTVADSGYMRMTKDERFLVMKLYNGQTYTEMQKQKKRRFEKTYPHRRDKFLEQEMLIELVDFGLTRSDESLFKSSFQMMNLKQLDSVQDSLKNEIFTSQRGLNNTIQESNFTKKREHLLAANYPTENDSTVQLDTSVFKVVTFNSDSIYATLNKDEKINILNESINAARISTNSILNISMNMDNSIRRLRRYEIETHRKFSMSLACIVFFFIGAPLGAIIRKGGLGMPVVVSVLLFILWYVISLMSEKMVRESVVPAWIGMWIATFILSLMGAFLTYKASTDSTVMNMETYANFFRKLRAKK